jgi:hypothetical protein
VEGIDFGKIFAPVARLETIIILLAFAVFKEFKLYQIDVKSAFLNGVIQEKVFVSQPTGFENPKYPDRVFKLSKALYEQILCEFEVRTKRKVVPYTLNYSYAKFGEL